jgi:hypothetical protein
MRIFRIANWLLCHNAMLAAHSAVAAMQVGSNKFAAERQLEDCDIDVVYGASSTGLYKN